MTPFFTFRSGNLKKTAFMYRVFEAVDYVLGMVTTTLKLCKINEISTLIFVPGKKRIQNPPVASEEGHNKHAYHFRNPV